jgi:hypothetical protein
MTHHILDLETLGIRPGCIVATVGIVKIDLTLLEVGEVFYQRIDLESSVRHGLSADLSTSLWWLDKPAEIRKELTDPGADDLPQALANITRFLGPAPVIYGNGPSFDCTHLSAAYRAAKMPLPWHFRDERCLRTEKAAILRQGGKWDRFENPFPHHAMHDALCEAWEFLTALKTMAPLPTIINTPEPLKLITT